MHLVYERRGLLLICFSYSIAMHSLPGGPRLAVVGGSGVGVVEAFERSDDPEIYVGWILRPGRATHTRQVGSEVLGKHDPPYSLLPFISNPFIINHLLFSRSFLNFFVCAS